MDFNFRLKDSKASRRYSLQYNFFNLVKKSHQLILFFGGTSLLHMFPLRCNKTQNSFLTLIPLHSSLEERNLCNPHMCIFKIHFIFSNFCNFLYDNNKVNNKEHNIKFWQETSEIQNICIFWSDLIEEQHSVTLRVWPPTQYQNFCQIPEFQFVLWRAYFRYVVDVN